MSEGTRYRVREGDCLDSIAARAGLVPETIWDDPENQSLRELRGSPSQLHEGDEVFVRRKQKGGESKGSDSKHSFKRKGQLPLFRLRVLQNSQPIADTAYVLHVDHKKIEGTTDGDGYLEARIPPKAKKGRLIVESHYIDCRIGFGELDPVDTVKGAQARLNNLGLECGEVDGDAAERTRAAVAAFQHIHELEPTGELDEATRQKLAEIHET